MCVHTHYLPYLYGCFRYGFWYNLLPNPTGPSATTTICPRFTPLGEFTNNRAHSNMVRTGLEHPIVFLTLDTTLSIPTLQFYGLRIHPEFYPSSGFCGNDINDVKARFYQVWSVEV